jgi:hypothetical protein
MRYTPLLVVMYECHFYGTCLGITSHDNTKH